MAQQNEATRGQVIGTVSFYLVAALAMVMANKWVLNTTTVPLFFLWTQLTIAVVLFLIAHAAKVVSVPMHVSKELIQGLGPLMILNLIGLTSNNFTLKYVDASFYQVVRGLVLPLTVFTSYLLLAARPSLHILYACAVVTAGFFVGIFLDGTYISPLGIFFGLLSSLMTALHAVVMKRSLGVVNNNALHLSWYSNLITAVMLIPCILLAGEGPAIWDLFVGAGVGLGTFAWGSAITGSIGFAMSIASVLSIKVTSPITHMISSAIRGVAASLLGMWIFGDILSAGRIWAIAIILAGSIYYTWIKHVESQSQHKSDYERVPLDNVEEGNATSPMSPKDSEGVSRRSVAELK
ncbi:unnamed protein product [Peniophora sp. CBMAI 1063]|nr:unnamed protein product [Peniophora sp. CBMAI 1063]